mmetsp:Transcript_10852/g.24616  ORF Transcript_10852/g.24616 Transcript_10852/m.24616 type:complete len:461 (+) Transcript_10852:72-1454(+)
MAYRDDAILHHTKFQAVYVLFMLICMLAWRRCGVFFLGHKRMQKVQASEYAALYIFFLWLLIDSTRRAVVRMHQIATLDDETLTLQFALVLSGTNLNVAKVVEEMSLSKLPSLKWASLLSPVPVFLTLVISAWDTWRHVNTMMKHSPKGRKGPMQAHDRAVQIIALPTAFALMSLSAVSRVWDVMCNSFSDDFANLDGWEERREVNFKFYKAHYQIADLYEAWALFQFGKLALEVIERKYRSMAIMEEGEDPLGPDRELQGSLMKLATDMHESVQKLTMQGIWAFVAVCGIESLYGVGTPMLQIFAVQLGMEEHHFVKPVLAAMRSGDTKVHYIFAGMGLVASSAAIGNIIQVERVLHGALEDFKPFWKFWGTKVLVSFAFLQQILVMMPVPPFNDMSETHCRLFYSVALCYECFFVSLLHLHAWRPDEAWYYNDEPFLPLRHMLGVPIGRAMSDHSDDL